MKAKKETGTLNVKERIKKYNTAELIEFLRGQDIGLSETALEPALKILENEDVNGRAFLNTTKKDLRAYGIKGGPATQIGAFAKKCKENRLRAFSSYRTKKDLKEVLEKHGVDNGEITDIPQFIPSNIFFSLY